MGRKIIHSFLKLIAQLPYRGLYFLSDLLYFIAVYILRYRRQVINENLKHAFPDKNERELRTLRHNFYRHLTDLVVETIKLLHPSPESLGNRCTIEQNRAFHELKNSRHGAIILTAHFGNWEWAGQVIGCKLEQPVNVIYKPLKSESFNEIMEKIRTIFGNEITTMKHVLRTLVKGRERRLVSCFLADQTPRKSEAKWWFDFLNRDAPFFSGPEKIARKLDLPVFFGEIRKTGRGTYHIILHTITRDPAHTTEQGITAEYVKLLEKHIREQPETWLWSHRRWKHDRKAEPAVQE